MNTKPESDREERLRKLMARHEDEWWDKDEFLRFLTRLSQGYPPHSRPRKFLEDYIADLQKNG